MAIIDRLSLSAVHLTIYSSGDSPVATATGFVVDTSDGRRLLTARHCFTGCHHYTGALIGSKTAAIPRRLIVRRHYGPLLVGMLAEVTFRGDEDRPLWSEHPEWGCLADIASIPFDGIDHDVTAPVALQDLVLTFRTATKLAAAQLRLLPSDQVSVIGYPFGISTASTLPIWATGTIASEPAFDYELGTMLIDCRARPGQSGAPVFAKRSGVAILTTGEQISFDGDAHSFIGMYVGRVRDDADIGIVYRVPALRALVERGTGGHDCRHTQTSHCRPGRLL